MSTVPELSPAATTKALFSSVFIASLCCGSGRTQANILSSRFRLREHLCLCFLRHCSLSSTVLQPSPVVTTNAPVFSVVLCFILLWFLQNPAAHVVLSLFAQRASPFFLLKALQSFEYSTPVLFCSNYQRTVLCSFSCIFQLWFLLNPAAHLIFSLSAQRASLSFLPKELQSLQYSTPPLSRSNHQRTLLFSCSWLLSVVVLTEPRSTSYLLAFCSQNISVFLA